MKIIDISIDIKPDMIKWPSDPDIQFENILSIENGNDFNFHGISLSTHTGTHIDAPRHFYKDGITVDKINPEVLIGKVLVVEISDDKKISKTYLTEIDLNNYSRIIFKTKNSDILFKNNDFEHSYVYLDIDAAKYLVDSGINVIGTDYLSVDKFNSSNYEVHKYLAKNNIIILETLDLSTVKPGEYFLFAMPLKLKGLDASPSRIVLISGLI